MANAMHHPVHRHDREDGRVDHSAFGKERLNEGCKSADEQDKKLQEALVKMGFQ